MQERSPSERRKLNELLIKNIMAGLHGAVIECLEKGADLATARDSDHHNAPALLCAVNYSDTKMVTILLEKGAKVNATNNKGATPIYGAAQQGHEEMVKLLMQHRADIELACDDKDTPIKVAQRGGFKKIVDLLESNADLNRAYIYNVLADVIPGVVCCLDRGANIEFKSLDFFKAPAICFAAGEMETTLLELLLHRGANIHAISANGACALHVAVDTGNEKSVAVLLQHGANVNQKRNDRLTPIHLAAANCHLPILQQLVKHKGNIDVESDNGNSLVMIALKKCDNVAAQTETVEWLLEQGVNPHQTNSHGESALHLAAQIGNTEVVKRLRALGLDMKAPARVSSTSRSTISALELARNNNHTEVVNFLRDCEREQSELDLLLLKHIRARDQAAVLDGIKKKANYNYQHGNEGPAITEATRINDAAMIELLVKSGAHTYSCQGTPPLHIAASEGFVEATSMLLNLGANINAYDEESGLTPLLQAALKGHEKVVAVLLAHKDIKPDLASKNQRKTPLHVAVIARHQSIFEMLLIKGCNPMAVTQDGQTALMLCFMDHDNPSLIAARKIIEAFAYYTDDKNLASFIREIWYTKQYRCELIAHYIMTSLQYPEKFTDACKEIFLENMMARFTPDERDEIKVALLTMTSAIKDPIERLEICDKALDLTQRNPLSVALNIKRSRYRTDCSHDKGKLAEFKKIQTELKGKLAPKEHQSMYDEQTLQDLRNSVKSALATRSALMIENTLSTLRELYQQERHPLIQAMILDLENASQQEMVAPTAPPLLSTRGHGIHPNPFGVFQSDSQSNVFSHTSNSSRNGPF